jgi:hypothetical protein
MALKTIKLVLTQREAEALLDAGNRGVADLNDVDDDESSAIAEDADLVLGRLGQKMAEAWPKADTVPNSVTTARS